MQVRVFNNHMQPITLDGGTHLSAAGTDGSEEIVNAHELTENDRRRAERGLFSIQTIPQAETQVPNAPDASASTAPATTKAAVAEKRSSK